MFLQKYFVSAILLSFRYPLSSGHGVATSTVWVFNSSLFDYLTLKNQMLVSLFFYLDNIVYRPFIVYIKDARLKSMIDNSLKKTMGTAVPKRKKTYTEEEETAEAQFKLSRMNIERGPT